MLAKKTIEVLDARMACSDVGDGDPVVLLHGNPMHGIVWHESKALADGLDLPNHFEILYDRDLRAAAALSIVDFGGTPAAMTDFPVTRSWPQPYALIQSPASSMRMSRRIIAVVRTQTRSSRCSTD